MNVKSITTAFFSPTGNTRKYLKEMTSESGIPVKVLDMTLPKLDNPQPFSFDDLVVVGAPVYGGRIPTVAMERFTKLEGNNTPCIILACFGNRAFDDALLEFAELFRRTVLYCTEELRLSVVTLMAPFKSTDQTKKIFRKLKTFSLVS